MATETRIKTLKQLEAYCKSFHVDVNTRRYKQGQGIHEVTLDCEPGYCFEGDLHGLVSANEDESGTFSECLESAIKDALNWCPQVTRCDDGCSCMEDE